MFEKGDIVLYDNQKCTIVDKRITADIYPLYMLVEERTGKKRMAKENLLRSISIDSEVDTVLNSVYKEISSIDTIRRKTMKLICKPLLNGIMAYWDKLKKRQVTPYLCTLMTK